MTQRESCPRCGAALTEGIGSCPGCGADVAWGHGLVGTDLGPVGTDLGPQELSPSQQAKADILEDLRRATIGEYEILGELGSGGMATVYLAHEILADRKVAIKVMSPALLVSEGMVERFKREARTSAKLVHPHIIPIYAVREAGKSVYFVMRYVGGSALDQVIKLQGTLPSDVAQTILREVGAALGHAHRHGVVHRDIKPSNIMLDEEGQALVTDFGIAKVNEAGTLTTSGATVGTPTYMSPEQWAGSEVTGASDQYSLGCVGYEMLTGEPPFLGYTPYSLMNAHCNQEPLSLGQRREDCPVGLERAIHRMLAKAPGDRFPTMAAAVAAIAAVGQHEGEREIRGAMLDLAQSSAKRRVIPVVRTPSSPPVALNREAGRRRRSATSKVRPRARLWIAAGVVGTLAVGVAVLFRVQSPFAPPDRSMTPQPAAPTSETQALDSPLVHTRNDSGLGDQAHDVSPLPAAESLNAGGLQKPGSLVVVPKDSNVAQVVAPPAGRLGGRQRGVGARRAEATGTTTLAGSPLVTAWVRIGTRATPPGTLLLNGKSMGAVVRPEFWEVAPGPVEIHVRPSSPQCKAWDTTFTIRGGDSVSIGYRNPICPE